MRPFARIVDGALHVEGFEGPLDQSGLTLERVVELLNVIVTAREQNIAIDIYGQVNAMLAGSTDSMPCLTESALRHHDARVKAAVLEEAAATYDGRWLSWLMGTKPGDLVASELRALAAASWGAEDSPQFMYRLEAERAEARRERDEARARVAALTEAIRSALEDLQLEDLGDEAEVSRILTRLGRAAAPPADAAEATK